MERQPTINGPMSRPVPPGRVLWQSALPGSFA
jgi:hypothetical protein